MSKLRAYSLVALWIAISLISVPVYGLDYTPLLARCGVQGVTHILANGIVSWTDKGEPKYYQVGIVDTTNPARIARVLSLSGRNNWGGYPQGWDIPNMTGKFYRQYQLRDANDIAQWYINMYGPYGTEVYALAFTRYNYFNQTGTPSGNHPCGSVAIPLVQLLAIEQ